MISPLGGAIAAASGSAVAPAGQVATPTPDVTPPDRDAPSPEASASPSGGAAPVATTPSTSTPLPLPVPLRPTAKPKYVPPPLPVPLGHTPKPEVAPESPATPVPIVTVAPATLAPATPPPATEPPAPTPAPTKPPKRPPTAKTPAPVITTPPTAMPATEAPSTEAPATLPPTPVATRTPRGGRPTVAPSLPTVPPIVEPTLPPRLPTPNPGGPAAGAPSAASLIERAIAQARGETQHPYIAYRLHKKLVVSEAFSQDIAYRVTERASDRLTRFEDVTTGAVRIGPPEPRRPDMPPALWGPDARDVNADVPYATTPSLLDTIHYEARVVGAEPRGSSLAYRILLEPHDGGLHDVLRSVLVDGATGRIVEVITRRSVPLRISVQGKVKDIEVPADVTIDYDYVDNSSVIAHLRLIGVAEGRTADFQYDIDGISFPADVPDDTFKPTRPGAVVPPPGAAADAMPPIPHLGGPGLTLIALGDSLTVGVGTNVCRGGCVTTPARPGSGLDVPGAVQNLATALNAAGGHVTFVPLGVTGANTGEAPKAEDPSSGDILANSGQLPALGAAVEAARARGDRVVVLLWSGSNDVFDGFYASECTGEGGVVAGATKGQLPCASAGTTLAGSLGDVTGGSFYRGYLRVVRAIALAKPDAIVAANVEDVSRLPKSLVYSDAERRRLAHDVDLANEAIVDALRDSAFSATSLVDLATYANGRPELFSAPYISSDGVHPSELGYRAIAAAMAEAALGRIIGTQ